MSTDKQRRRRTANWTIEPPKVIPMTPEEYDRAVKAWAALIAAWWTAHPEKLRGDASEEAEESPEPSS